jgi:hypothetical protein
LLNAAALPLQILLLGDGYRRLIAATAEEDLARIMSDDRGPRSRAPSGVEKQAGRGGSDESWLEHQVRETYRAVVDEPIPKELLEIVRRIPRGRVKAPVDGLQETGRARAASLGALCSNMSELTPSKFDYDF